MIYTLWKYRVSSNVLQFHAYIHSWIQKWKTEFPMNPKCKEQHIAPGEKQKCHYSYWFQYTNVGVRANIYQHTPRKKTKKKWYKQVLRCFWEDRSNKRTSVEGYLKGTYAWVHGPLHIEGVHVERGRTMTNSLPTLRYHSLVLCYLWSLNYLLFPKARMRFVLDSFLYQ